MGANTLPLCCRFCGVTDNLVQDKTQSQGFKRICKPCLAASRRTRSSIYPTVKCLDCPATFVQIGVGNGTRVRCGVCQAANVRERNILRLRERRQIMRNRGASSPRRCQVCGFGAPKLIAPDGTGVRCCEPCYKDCETLLALEAKRKACCP
jgi:hypothetical protein